MLRPHATNFLFRVPALIFHTSAREKKTVFGKTIVAAGFLFETLLRHYSEKQCFEKHFKNQTPEIY